MENKEKLTLEERYKIPINMVVETLNVEYFQCGSHKLYVKAITDLENLQELYNSIKNVKGIIL